MSAGVESFGGSLLVEFLILGHCVIQRRGDGNTVIATQNDFSIVDLDFKNILPLFRGIASTTNCFACLRNYLCKSCACRRLLARFGGLQGVLHNHAASGMVLKKWADIKRGLTWEKWLLLTSFFPSIAGQQAYPTASGSQLDPYITAQLYCWNRHGNRLPFSSSVTTYPALDLIASEDWYCFLPLGGASGWGIWSASMWPEKYCRISWLKGYHIIHCDCTGGPFCRKTDWIVYFSGCGAVIPMTEISSESMLKLLFFLMKSSFGLIHRKRRGRRCDYRAIIH